MSKVLNGKELAGAEVRSTKVSVYLWYSLPEPRPELLGLLLADNARGFVERMTAHFELLVEFIPFVDKIFESARRKRG